MTSTALAAGLDWLHDTLAADSALATAAPGGVWDGVGPRDTSLVTFVVCQNMSAQSVLYAQRRTVYSSQLWWVKVVGLASDWANIVAANVRIAALFDFSSRNFTTQQTADAYIEECYLAGERKIEEPLNAQLWEHYGQLIQIGVVPK